MDLEPFKDFFSSLFIEANAIDDRNINALC